MNKATPSGPLSSPGTYEYALLESDTMQEAEQVLNDMAGKGWRVISVIPFSPTAYHQMMYQVGAEGQGHPVALPIPNMVVFTLEREVSYLAAVKEETR